MATTLATLICMLDARSTSVLTTSCRKGQVPAAQEYDWANPKCYISIGVGGIFIS